MANTYNLISSSTLSSSAASVTFGSIPATYTDLVLRWSARSDGSGTLGFLINNDSSAVYSRTRVYGTASAAGSSLGSNNTSWLTYTGATPSTYTTNSFSSGEFYISSYANSANKVGSMFYAVENNSTVDWIIAADADLRSSTAAITEIKAQISSGNFVTGSSFYLYGIKNS